MSESYEDIIEQRLGGNSSEPDSHEPDFKVNDLFKANEQIEALTTQKNQAYWERNQLVVALSKMFPSSLGRHEESDLGWERDWMNIVYVVVPIDGQESQLSWHIHDSELPLFAHLSPFDLKWDGHTTEEKYERLSKLKRSY